MSQYTFLDLVDDVIRDGIVPYLDAATEYVLRYVLFSYTDLGVTCHVTGRRYTTLHEAFNRKNYVSCNQNKDEMVAPTYPARYVDVASMLTENEMRLAWASNTFSKIIAAVGWYSPEFASFFVELNYLTPKQIHYAATMYSNMELVQASGEITSLSLYAAVENVEYELVEELHEYFGGYRSEWKFECTDRAAFNGDLKMLQWLIDHGHPIGVTTMENAAYDGRMETIKFLRDKGVQLNEKITAAASKCGQIETLDWLISEGCPVDLSVVAKAAKEGEIKVLEWWLSRGNTIEEEVSVMGACNLETHLWLYQNRLPIDWRGCLGESIRKKDWGMVRVYMDGLELTLPEMVHIRNELDEDDEDVMEAVWDQLDRILSDERKLTVDECECLLEFLDWDNEEGFINGSIEQTLYETELTLTELRPFREYDNDVVEWQLYRILGEERLWTSDELVVISKFLDRDPENVIGDILLARLHEVKLSLEQGEYFCEYFAHVIDEFIMSRVEERVPDGMEVVEVVM